MADNDRMQFLKDSIDANPNDTFARYALALEFARAGQPDAAWEQFRYLLDHHADYSATYYQAGTLLADQGRMDEARHVFEKGIEVTRRLGHSHAASELQAALEALDE
jgi:Tfp pilus assembly protein PilF